MLTDELVQAWKAAAAAHNERLRAQQAGHVVYGTVPDTLQPDETVFLMALYSRPEFDGLCSGADRHAKFAQWAVSHHAEWQRAIETARWAHVQACELAAGRLVLAVNSGRA